MTSDRKTNANRANARVSTGPNTLHGRARSARNAFRHGLSLSIQSDQALGEEAQTLARQIAGPSASAQIQMLACRVAEAEVDLRRVRLARHQLVSQALSNLANASEVAMAAREKVVPSTRQGGNNILSREAKALEAMHASRLAVRSLHRLFRNHVVCLLRLAPAVCGRRNLRGSRGAARGPASLYAGSVSVSSGHILRRSRGAGGGSHC